MNNDLYREELLDHYHHPRNFGKPKDVAGKPGFTHKADKNNPVCGDHIEAYVIIEKGVVTSINFAGSGCAVSIASASMLSEELVGKKVEELMKVGTKEVLEITKMNPTPSRLKCALLSLEVLHRAIS